MAYIDITLTQQTAIGVRVAGLSSYYTHRYADFYIRTASGSYSYIGRSGMIGTSDTASSSVTQTGLTPATTYIIKAEVYNYYNDTLLWSDTLSVTTLSPTPNPYSWSWTTTERNALDNKGKVNTITWQRWNEFCEQVRLTTVWYYGSDPYGCNNAKMSADSKVMTATRFRIIKNAIGSMNPTGIDDSLIQTGKTVYGSYFVTLSQKYNAITKSTTYSLGTNEQLYNMDVLMISAKIEDMNREGD